MKTSPFAITVLILGLGAGVATAEQPVAAPPGPVPPPIVEPLAGYDKGFYIHGEDGDFALRINGRVQVRLTLDSVEAAGDRDQDAAFSIPRARIKMSGHAYSEAIQYELQADFGKGFVTLKDFYVDYDLGAARVRAGQWKRPFSRQQITSSGSLSLVDRAITDDYFEAGRDIGVAIHNGYETSPEGLGWVLGVYNGTGDKPVFSGSGTVVDPITGEVEVESGGFSNVPDSFAPALVGRVDLNQGRIKGFSEADLEGGPLRWAVGASVLTELDADGDDASSVRGELDYIVKAQGFSTTGGIYAASAQDGTGFLDQGYAAVGFHLQAGYVIDDTYQPVLRYSLIVPEAGDELHELLAGFSIYAYSHKLKWQTDAGFVSAGGFAMDPAFQARTQLQLAF